MMSRMSGVLVAVLGVMAAGLIFASCQAPGSVLRGNLTTTTGTHVAGVAVTVYSTTGTVAAQTTTDSYGDYSFLPATLPDGTYKILFATNDWWNNATSLADATPVPVSTSTPAVINATVNVATGSVTGTVTNTATSTPASGVSVAAISTISGSKIATTATAGDGTYSFGSLPAGNYVFEFTATGLTTRYNGSAFTQATAPVITVTGDSIATGIDTTLTTNSTITGTVTDGTNPAPRILIGAFDPATGQVLGGTFTASDGTFTIPDLNNAPYTVEFDDVTGNLQRLVYGSASLDPTTGTPVTPVNGTVNIGTIALAPYTVPEAPTAVTATPGDSQATITWTAPDNNGGSTITGYTVYSSTGQSCTTTGATTCTVTGLTNGTTVYFAVKATNTTGTSNQSTVSTGVVIGFPTQPTDVNATSGDSQATITWVAPATTGGSPVTGYTVTSTPDSQTCGTTTALTCTVTGLTNGTSYTFTVTATNNNGTSPASGASNPVIPATTSSHLTNVTSITTGDYTTCSVADGSGYCWGANGQGQVGNGDTTGANVYTRYKLPLTNVTSIPSNGGTTCAVADGNGYCWGENGAGSVGNGDTTGANVYTPYKLPLTNVTSITSYGSTTCAVAGGNGYCWGYNGFGEVGNGDTAGANVYTPYKLPLTNVTSITTRGTDMTCAVAGGNGYCWGYNSQGEVGNGDTTGVIVYSPYELPLTNVTSITISGTQMTCAVADGSGYCWGYNQYGQVGNGDTAGANVYTPYKLPLTNVTSITTDDHTTCAVADGNGYCWGENNYGQVGNGDTSGATVYTPYELPLTNVTSMSTDNLTTCAVAGGDGYCWGENFQGLVGNGDTSGAAVYTPYELPLTNVTSLSTSFTSYVTCAVAGGNGYCWGDNQYGGVGSGYNPNYFIYTPYQL